MKRQSTRRRETNTSERCKWYADESVYYCEVWKYLVQDAGVAKLLHSKPTDGQFEVHHIHKRPLPKERDYFSNLLYVADASHAWLTVNVHEGELACWYAKYELHCRELLHNAGHGRDLPEDVSRHNWHVPTLDRICVGYDGIRGRLHYLLGHDVGAVFRGYGERLLKVLEAGDV